MKNFTKKAAAVAMAAMLLTGIVDTPPVSAQELTSKEGCYKGVWVNTGQPVVDRFVKAVDLNTGLPHPTVEAATEWASAVLAFYPAMSSYIAGTTFYCNSSS